MFFGDFSTQEIGEDSKMNQVKHIFVQMGGLKATPRWSWKFKKGSMPTPPRKEGLFEGK